MAEKKQISLTIDDVVVKVPEGSTIMDAADSIGVAIPRLCYHPHLSILGACRVCLVWLCEAGERASPVGSGRCGVGPFRPGAADEPGPVDPLRCGG